MLAGDALCVLTRPAPRVAPEAFLALPLEGERMLWDDRGQPGEADAVAVPWAFAGRGVAARVEAWDEGRFVEARDAASRLFASLLDLGEPGAPTLRVFGGVSFQPQGASRSRAPWSGFADASFVLPRWTYCVSERAAFVRVAVPGSELRAIEGRLASIVQMLDHPELVASAPAANDARLVEMDRDDWDELVHDALRSIRRNELAKVVTARRSAVTLRAPIDLPTALRRMRELEPTCTRFALEREGGVFLGATPERLAVLRGLRLAVDALAGSIPRRADGTSGPRPAWSTPGDTAGHPPAWSTRDEVQELLASDKDQREHAMVVEGIRTALAPFCAHIDVPEPPIVRTLRAVHHLWTPIRATLREPTHVLDLVAAVHPTPAVCGLPRERARGWIAEHEPTPRGWYASPVGWLDADGEGQFAVAIRSALVKGTDAWLFAGAGIVEGSDAALEYRETGVKQTTMLAALGVAR